ncbi:hypothetical protein CUMW_113690 [Citrus unshiu]|nr:hypothetical protein CUMW_113690 [Citrus unshiu]
MEKGGDSLLLFSNENSNARFPLIKSILIPKRKLKTLTALRHSSWSLTNTQPRQSVAPALKFSGWSRDKRLTYKLKDQKGFPLSSKDKGIPKHTLEGKSDLSGSSEEEGSEGVVQADFVFFDPKPDDFHGVKILLQTYLDDTQWDLSGFVDLILAQTTVGTVVKIEGDDDDTPFSIDHKCIKDLKEFLLKVCQEKDVIRDLRLLMGEQAHDVGLLVSQRVVNLPPQLLPPLHDALFDEVSWATEDEPTAELRNSFRFKCYLLVSKIYKVFLSWHLSTAPYILIINFFLLMIGFNNAKLKHKNANQKNNRNLIRRSGSDSGDGIVYIKPEDEIFHKLSLWSFSFPMHTQQVETQEARAVSSHLNFTLKDYRLMGLVMAVETAKISTFRQQLHFDFAPPKASATALEPADFFLFAVARFWRGLASNFELLVPILKPRQRLAKVVHNSAKMMTFGHVMPWFGHWCTCPATSEIYVVLTRK